MKAIRVRKFGGPEVLRLDTVDDPRPGRGQLLIRMHAVGINPVETYIRAGQYATLPELPWTPGTDGSGTVEAVGQGAIGFRAGQRVYVAGTATGSYAELAVADADDVHPLPDNVSFEQGAAIGVPYATAYRALFQRARALPGETVLVHGGTGAVGMATVQLAVAAGLRVLASGGSETGRALLTAQGAAYVFDHHHPETLSGLLDFTHGRGADVVVEMLANANLGDDLRILAEGGRIAVVGCRGTVEINPRDLMQRSGTILGVLLWKTSVVDMVRIHAALRAGLAAGSLKPIIARHWPLGQAPQAHRALHAAEAAHGKLVLIP
ncbi:MAG TPA: NADPH:quinone reductase [Nevskiaceae bacterium]